MLLGVVLLFVAVGVLALIGILLLAPRGQDPLARRVEGIRAERSTGATTLFAPAGQVGLPSAPNEAEVAAARQARQTQTQQTLRDRLVQAGLYQAYSPAGFTIARIVLALCPLGFALYSGLAGHTPLVFSLVCGGAIAGIGTLAPSFWLDHLKRARQMRLRRSLPDALDVIVVCLEGGLSLSSAISRVGQELISAHPLLATELRIVQREVQMGRTMGEALREFAKRFDLEELRSLAQVVSQAEKFGTSVVRALSVFAETMRTRRYQRAEELGHQASIKMIFPTLFCIFPAIFVVVLGPAAVRIYDVFIGKGLGGL